MPAGRVFRQVRAQYQQRDVFAEAGATFYTNTFTGANGSAPLDFVLSEAGGTGGTIDIQSNQLRTLTTATNFNTQRLILPSANWNNSDGEARITVTTQVGVGQLQLLLRASGDWSVGDNTSATNCYKALINMPGNTVSFYKTVAGTTTQIGTDQAFTFADSTTYGIAFKIVGSTLSLKVWSGAEPGPYTYTQTDSAIAGPGQFQMNFRTVSTAVRDLRYDNPTLTSIGMTAVTGTLAVTLGDVQAVSPVLDENSLPILDENSEPIYGVGATGGGNLGTASATLGDVTSAASGAVYDQTPVPYSAPPILIVTRGLYRKRYVMHRGPQGQVGVGISGSVSVTLANVQAISPLLDENSLPILDENSQPIYGLGASATFGNTGTLSKTLGNVTSTTAGSSVTGTLARALQNLLIAASGGSSNAGTLARTLDPVVVQGAGGVGGSGTVARTLGNVTSSASGAFGAGVFGTVAVTLAAVEANSALTDDLGSPILDDNSLPILVRGAEGAHAVGGTVAKSLANITSVASGFATATVTGTVAKSLADVTSVTSAASGASGTVARTLANTTSTTAGTVGVTGALAVTLGNTTSTAAGTSTPGQVAGNLSVTLANATSAASGSSVGGSLARTLADATLAASGTAGPVPVTGTLAVTLAPVTSDAAGYPVNYGTLNRTLEDLVGDGIGSSVAGSLNETLDDVTSSTSGTVTITVFGVGDIEAVYQTGRIDSVFETGRIRAVARSRS